MQCPRCQRTRVIKNGRIHNGKPKWLCKDCRRQFVENPQHRVISEATKGLIDKLLLERVSLAGMARVAEVSERWLQYYVNAHYAALPRAVTVTAKKRGG
jgi:insertion element IS1 protein InsB